MAAHDMAPRDAGHELAAAEQATAVGESDSAPGWRARLVPPMPGSRVWGWVGPLVVTVFAGLLRFYRLGAPHAIVFDETYYVGDAWGILQHGIELNHVKNANALLARGDTHILLRTPELVAHPPLGKMMIAVGEWLFGLTPFGWRFSVALVGTLAVLLTARIARRMTRSTLLGCVAGLLVALDGLEFVLSRTAILDIFVMFWVLAAFGLLVIDRDRSRARLADEMAARRTAALTMSRGGRRVDSVGRHRDPADPVGPKLGIRWLRLLAGICLGLACACKWNGVWYIPAFAAAIIAWDLGARRAVGFAEPWRGALRDAKWLPVSFGVVPVAVYAAAWSGWFANPNGYYRNWAAQHGNHTPVWSVIDSWLQYNKWMLHFGLGLTSGQNYKSNPFGWLLLMRPIAFWYATPKGCGASNCSQEVLTIGTPAIWWAAVPVLVACLAWWLIRHDWRPGVLLLCVAAGWLPWMWFYLHDHRTEFLYYAVQFLPYVAIAITLCLGLLIGRAGATVRRRALGAVVVGVYLILVLVNFAYLYPILAAKVIPYSSWLSRMWFHSWI